MLHQCHDAGSHESGRAHRLSRARDFNHLDNPSSCCDLDSTAGTRSGDLVGARTIVGSHHDFHAIAFDRSHPGSVAQALEAFESGRREEVERMQHAADVSLVWFEHVDRFRHMEPTQFSFGLMTRSRAVTYDNLALRAADAPAGSHCSAK